MNAQDYIDKGEEWCTAHSDKIDWNKFEFHADKFSKDFEQAFINEIEVWIKNGEYHREDGPAIKRYRSYRWFINGKLHREDGPAVIYRDGSEEWYLHGKLHRTDGPAIELVDGTKEWYLNGNLHREDGPAIIRHDGIEQYFVYGKFIPKVAFFAMKNLDKV